MTMSGHIVNGGQFGDTTLTKVFVGGLAWETPKEALRDHFDKYGDILEAVIISDKLTGRSKGYGFVTFKEAEAAKKACEDSTPVINGRRANCNLASLGAKRQKPTPSTSPPVTAIQIQGSNGGNRSTTPAAHPGHVQWYYPAATQASPYHHQQQQHHHQTLPYYGYSTPTYVATDISYNHKLSYTGAAYMNGNYSQMYHHHPGQHMMSGNTLMPMYPLYQYHHQSQTMGLPTAHFFPQTTSGPIATIPAIFSKPSSVVPPPNNSAGTAPPGAPMRAGGMLVTAVDGRRNNWKVELLLGTTLLI